MKLATRITVSSLAAVVGMTAVAGYYRIHAAYEEFEVQQREDAERIAEGLSEMLRQAWTTDGSAGVNRLLGKDGLASKFGLTSRWVWFEDQTSPDNRPHLAASLWPSSASRDAVSIITADAGGGRQMHTYVPVTLDPNRHGGLELTESMDSLDQSTRRKIWIDLAAIVALGLIGFGIAHWAGTVWIARPLRALIEKTRRIGRGDFAEPLELRRRDELSELAGAINSMCCQLTDQQAAIAAETAQRLATLEQLRHADRLKTVGRLAAGIAHEMGTPLNVIAGRASLIALGKLAPEEVLSSARTIKSEADRITAILRHLLDFARRRAPHRAVTDLHALAARTADLFQHLARQKNVRIEVAPASAPVTASVDAFQIQQVLTNLLTNALQAMHDGGLVRVETGDAPALPASDAAQRFARISVADEGTGIPPEALEHIFEPFFTTKDVGQGTGLGLSIVYGLIQEHGGRIEVTSEVGRGSCFTVYLPAEEQG